MPRAMRVCSQPGCPALTDGGRCTEHRRAADRARGTRYERGYDARWAATRAEHIKRYEPMCRQCGAAGQQVDHIDGLGPNGPRGHDHTNLRTLCASCHSKRTAADQPGGWNRR